MKQILKFLLLPFHHFLAFFYVVLLESVLFQKINKIADQKQLFFILRPELGASLMLMHYANCWSQTRNDVCIVIILPNAKKMKRLAKCICPHIKCITLNNFSSKSLSFFPKCTQHFVLNQVYAAVHYNWPQGIFLNEMNYCRRKHKHLSGYVAAFDPHWQKENNFSNEFIKAYLKYNQHLDHRKIIYQDMIKLSNQYQNKISKKEKTAPELLQNLKINSEYVVINLNCKNYKNQFANNRTIHYPERYNALIDFLISKGYLVIIQGRSEQPKFSPRKGLIEYFSSPYLSVQNDYYLFSHCKFAILCKTGPEIFGPICNIPVLGLNFTELSCIIPNSKRRFFPKHVLDTKTQTLIHWKDLLKRPCFYDIDSMSYEKGIQYIDLEEEEMLTATEEFLNLLSKSYSEWINYTPLQKQFKTLLHPMHLDLYDIVDVPCDSYLSSKKYSPFSLKA